VTSVTDPLGNVTRYTYDTRGNLATSTDPNGNKTTFAVNAFGLVTQSSTLRIRRLRSPTMPTAI